MGAPSVPLLDNPQGASMILRHPHTPSQVTPASASYRILRGDGHGTTPVPSRQRGTSAAGGRRREAGSRMTHAGRERKISCRSNPGRNMGFQIYGYCPMRLMETQFRCRIGQRRVDTRDGGMYRTRYHRHKAPRPAQIHPIRAVFCVRSGMRRTPDDRRTTRQGA
jgi:hypothetical protein